MNKSKKKLSTENCIKKGNDSVNIVGNTLEIKKINYKKKYKVM